MAQRKKMLNLIKNLIENNDNTIVKSIKKRPVDSMKKEQNRKSIINKLSIDEQELIFNQILACNSMNLFQKINIFDKFKLHARAPLKTRHSFRKYCEVHNISSNQEEIGKRIQHLSPRDRFIFNHKYNQFVSRNTSNQDLIASLRRVMKFSQDANDEMVNGDGVDIANSHTEMKLESESERLNKPMKSISQINHVAFCAGEYSHLVIVCTENRLLIWNLLTLRLQSSFKLSVTSISVDIYTGLVAAFTSNNELTVFLPNTPIPLYQRRDMPRVLGMAWLPRRFPRAHSLTVDWQASTELYILSENQVNFMSFHSLLT